MDGVAEWRGEGMVAFTSRAMSRALTGMTADAAPITHAALAAVETAEHALPQRALGVRALVKSIGQDLARFGGQRVLLVDERDEVNLLVGRRENVRRSHCEPCHCRLYEDGT